MDYLEDPKAGSSSHGFKQQKKTNDNLGHMESYGSRWSLKGPLRVLIVFWVGIYFFENIP